MRSRKTGFPLFGMALFATVLLLPHTTITQGKLEPTAPQASSRPIMIADGPDPVPKLPPPKTPIPPKAFTA
jgi:hypothetical protein